MGDVLTQSEIDSLLEMMANGGLEEVPEEKEDKGAVVQYDFKTANKFTRDHLKTFANVYGNFSHMLSTYLSGTLRTTCKVDVLSTEELAYSEYMNSVASPTILAIFDMQPFDGGVVLEMTASVVYTIINRLLGGIDNDIDFTKQFTDIDIAIITKVIKQITKFIDDAWSRVLPTTTKLSRIETGSQFVQVVAYNEPTAIITIKIDIGDDIEGFINVCIPYIAIEQVIRKLDESMWLSSKKIIVNEENKVAIKNKMMKSSVDMTARFNSSTITFRDFLALEVGDVLRLKHNVNEDLELSVGDIPKFKAKLGVYNKNYAVKITSMIEEEEEDVGNAIPGGDK